MVIRFALSAFAALVWITPVSADEIKAATMADMEKYSAPKHVKKDDDGDGLPPTPLRFRLYRSIRQNLT